MRLIWTSNSASGSTLTLRRSPISRASTILLWCLTLRNCCWKAPSLARASSSSSLLGSSSTASPQASRNRLVSLGLASISQRRKVMPLVLLVMRDIDAVDDFQMARQQAFEQFDRPGLERFRQQRMVGVGQRRHGDLPRFLPAEVVNIAENAHQLGDGQTGMGVVELHGGL